MHRSLGILLAVILAIASQVGCNAAMSDGDPSGNTSASIPPLTISSGVVPDGVVGAAYSATMTATGGVAPYSWNMSPAAGLTIDMATGRISGVPISSGTLNLVITVNDSGNVPSSSSKTFSANIKSTPTTAGGLISAQAPDQVGAQELANNGFEQATTDWGTVGACWAMDTTVGHSASSSMRYDAGPTGCSFAYQNVTRNASSARAYTLRAWFRGSSGTDLKAKLALHDAHDSSMAVAGTAYVVATTTWQMIEIKDIDLLPMHDGETLTVRLLATGTTGSVWFDDVELVEQLPNGLAAFLVYPNFRGYLWEDGPQSIRVHVSVDPRTAPMAAIVHASIKDANGGGVQHADVTAVADQELTMPASGLAFGTFTLSVSLRDAAGQTLGNSVDYGVTKVTATFRNSLQTYIDPENFLVANGERRFVSGAYERFSSARCLGCLYNDAASYESKISGFLGMNTLQNYADTKLNTVMSISQSGANATQLQAWAAALNNRGAMHLQLVNNWVSGNQYRPSWATAMTDAELWKTAATTLQGKPGALGYDTFDEPTKAALPAVTAQYKVLRENNPGSITFGTLVGPDQVFRWRDASDVLSCDPYPLGAPISLNDIHENPTVAPPMVRTAVWTREAVRQVYVARPVWMVVQSWRYAGQYPTYDQLKTQAYKAIINGATGVLWWGYVSVQGMEGEVIARGNTQAYLDFQRLSGEVTSLEKALTGNTHNEWVGSVSNARVQYLVRTDATNLVVFATNNSDQPQTAKVVLASGAPAVTSAITVHGEARSLTLDSVRSFSDSFNGNESHVYVLALK